MTRYADPVAFMTHYDAPFNFDYGWEEFDADYHAPSSPINDAFRPKSDPCQWSDDLKAEVNAERDKWMALWGAWCRGAENDA